MNYNDRAELVNALNNVLTQVAEISEKLLENVITQWAEMNEKELDVNDIIDLIEAPDRRVDIDNEAIEQLISLSEREVREFGEVMDEMEQTMFNNALSHEMM